MLTTLMMLLGLSGEGKEMDRVGRRSEPDDALSPRQRRRKRAKEDTVEKPSEIGNSGIPEPAWGGRGKELPFQTDSRQPSKTPTPLTEDLDLPELDDSQGGEPSPRSKRRNRKDKKSPSNLEDIPLGDFGGESESPTSQERPRRDRPDMSYGVDDIITKNSKYSFHRRPLLNAEALVQGDQVEEAIEIFERTGNRIPDQEIRDKIQKNIQDLEEYLEDNKAKSEDLPTSKDKDTKETGKPKPEKTKLKEDRKLRDPGFAPTPGNLAGTRDLSDLVSALKEVSELFAESIAKAIQYAGKAQSQENFRSDLPAPSFEPKPQIPPQSLSGETGSSNTGQIVHPIVYQFLQSSAESQTIDPKAFENTEQLLKSLNKGLTDNSLAGFPNFPMAPPGSGLVGPFYAPEKETKAEQPNKPLDLESLKDEIQKRDVSELDLPEDTFFSNDWKQFKDLPLVDRRSGDERRKNPDRRSNLAGRKDRRSGEDRRKVDRFKEREEFLKNKALQKLEKKAQVLPKEEPESLNDLVKPFFPEGGKPVLPELIDLELIGLPEAEEYRRDKPAPEKKEEEWIEGEDPNWFEKTTDALRKELELPEPVEPKRDSMPTSPPPFTPTDDPLMVELLNRPLDESLRIGLPDADEVFRKRKAGEEGTQEAEDLYDKEPPEIEIVDGNLGEIAEEESPISADEMSEKADDSEPEKIIHGVLELKPPEADDAPFLTLTYDFGKIPHAFRLSKNYSIMEYSYFKYKPMLMKAQEFARRKMLKNALNYYRVIKSQNIPPELRKMINRNIRDITEFMEKFLMAKGN